MLIYDHKFVPTFSISKHEKGDKCNFKAQLKSNIV